MLTVGWNMKTLDRQKLDVTNKTRSNPALRGWQRQFRPEFVRQSAEVFAES
jgi:hypothetical protein